jgi:BirA family biotin operon repressor/biotin-[acetyl-CoA-carboxylase] ligase
MGDCAPLDVDWIELARRDAIIGRKVVVFKSTGSTNDIAWAYAGNAAHHGVCVLAEEQTQGRGRRGRTWASRPGESILCSILLIDTAIEAELLTLTAAVATAEAVRDFCGVGAGIKWPNDVLVNGKKLAGILVEKRTVKGRMCYVIGVGINCNQEAEAFEGCELRTPATSGRIETGKSIDRTGLACAVMGAMEEWLGKAVVGTAHPTAAMAGKAHPPQNPVVRRWTQLSTLLGRHVTVECDNRIYRGYCRGVDPAEGLVVQLESGAVRAFAAGHTSIVRGE